MVTVKFSLPQLLFLSLVELSECHAGGRASLHGFEQTSYLHLHPLFSLKPPVVPAFLFSAGPGLNCLFKLGQSDAVFPELPKTHHHEAEACAGRRARVERAESSCERKDWARDWELGMRTGLEGGVGQ